ncbi:MAG: TonB-dependent receptor [Calditrichaeota bacterium]|nr:TonB-dependent receptor [Calditrichota bacterium]RQW02643.1 MAG: TonB-dependent receptor [Calditrichota bacterium]
MKGIITTLSVILLLFSFLQAGSIKGVVKDAETGDFLVGANVILGKTILGTTTDDDGFFILENVPIGKWMLHVTYIGYIDVNREVLVGNQPVDLTITMEPTVFRGSEVIVEVNRAEERKTPVTFSEVGESEIQQRYATQDVPDLLKTVPGVFTTTAGLGESAIFIRGFDAERIQILINGVPVNDPESQVVYWSNWTGLSGNAASIQVQRGVGASLLGSGAFGGSVNIVTSKFSPRPKMNVRTSIAGYYTTGGFDDTRRIADGTGGSQTYNPFNQIWSIDYTTGLLLDGKLNVYLKYERKSGDYYLANTYYNGHSFYLGLQSILGRHILTFNAHGAPQRHFQASAAQDKDLLDRLGREYNRYNHPYQENYYFKPQFELHWDWAMSDKAYLKTNAFVTFGRGGGRYLRNDFFDVNTGEVGFKEVNEFTDWLEFGRHARFTYDNLGVVLVGYDPVNNTYTYGSTSGEVTRSRMLTSSQYSHSWRNDSQNDHNQFGVNTAYQRQLNEYLTFVLGGEARYWNAHHFAQSFYFRKLNLTDGSVKELEEVQQRYDYDGIVTNLSGFGRLLISPIQDLTVMLDGQYASYSSKVEENPMRVYDFALESWTPYTYLSTKDKKDAQGNPLFQDSDYERTFSFFMPKVGANYNLSKKLNVFANYSISKKEPKVGDWYARDNGPGVNQLEGQELKEETLTNIEVGAGYQSRFIGAKANFYIMNFDDKIESVLDQSDNRITINAGKARFTGVELQTSARYRRYDALLTVTYSQNRWQEMNVKEIFGIPSEDVVDKVVPFFPERMIHAEVGYNFGPFRIGLGTSYWDEYYGNYDNTASLPAYFSLDAMVNYTFNIGGTDVDMRLNLNNITSRENFMEAAWSSDFNRNDALVGLYRMYVVQGPLFHSFFTTQISL